MSVSSRVAISRPLASTPELPPTSRRLTPPGLPILLLAAALAGACGHATERSAPAPRAGGAAEVEAAVLAEIEAYYRDFSARDWEAFASHFWPGATITTAWQPPGEDVVRVVVTTIPEFVAQAPEGPGSREVFEERMTAADVRITGNLAQVWARYSARFGDPGEIVEWEGIDAFTLMAHEGRWKITALAFTSDP